MSPSPSSSSPSFPPPPEPQPPPPPSDPTFRFYTPSQATTYAAHRPGYAGPLLDHILHLHATATTATATSATATTAAAASCCWDTVLDVGTGTGQVVRAVAPRFASAVGVDPGVEMIAQAEALGGYCARTAAGGKDGGQGEQEGRRIVFLVAAAEEIDQLDEVEQGSVDLITAGMAAHWFDMPKFWTAAAHVLKPGGSVALWTKSSFYCHPASTPNAARVQAILSDFEDIVLGPYALPPNKLSQNNYRDLVLPWDCPEPIASLFDRATLQRHEWDVGGTLTSGHEGDFFGGGTDTTLAALRQGMGTASMVTRWRAAHPELVGTERDCVSVLVNKLKEALLGGGGEVGNKKEVKEEEEVSFRTGMGTGLLFLQRAK